MDFSGIRHELDILAQLCDLYHWISECKSEQDFFATLHHKKNTLSGNNEIQDYHTKANLAELEKHFREHKAKGHTLDQFKALLLQEVKISAQMPLFEREYNQLAVDKQATTEEVLVQLKHEINLRKRCPLETHTSVATDYQISNRRFGFELEVDTHKITPEGQYIEEDGKRVETEQLIHDIFTHLGLPHTHPKSIVKRNFNCWKIIYDEDLIEIVSPILSGEEGVQEICLIADHLHENDINGRTGAGLHVHNDATDHALETYKNILKNYLKNEEKIANEGPIDRRAACPENPEGNKNIRPIAYFLKDNTEALERIENAVSIAELKTVFHNKKATLSIKTNYETTESRHKQATTRSNEIREWIYRLDDLIMASIRGTTPHVFEHGVQEGLKRYATQSDLMNYAPQDESGNLLVLTEETETLDTVAQAA